MNLGQIHLVVAAMAILATLQLSINSSIVRTFLASMDTEATIDAISIGEGMIDEAVTKNFDQITSKIKVYTTDSLTSYYSFGPDTTTEYISAYETEPFQSASHFNDLDDYHRYTRIVSSPRLGKFTVRDSVFYVQESNKDAFSNTNTWYKKIVVTVSHPNLVNPVVVKSLMVYRRYF